MFKKVPYIIAEVGSNWHTYLDCVKSIEQAAKAGADAVKFQLFTSHDLYGVDLADWLGKKWELPESWLSPLKLVCLNNNVDFMCTVFNPKKVGLVDHLVSYHKVASSDCGYSELLATINRSDKGAIISTGGASEREIDDIQRHLKGSICLLYCQPEYPPQSRPRLIEIERLTLDFVDRTGFSDHTQGISWAISAGIDFDADVIEKHFRLEGIENTPDYGHSVDEIQFADMVTLIRFGNENKYKAIEPPPFKRQHLPHGYYRPLP